MGFFYALPGFDRFAILEGKHKPSSMRSIYLVVFILLVGSAYGQRKPKIKGNRQPVEVQGNLEYFSRVEVGEDVPLTLVSGGEAAYVINADDNLVDVFRFQVVDSTLRISSFYRVGGHKALDITVTFPQLDLLSITGSEVKVERPKGQSLQVELGEKSQLEGILGGGFVNLDLLEDSKTELRIGADTLVVSTADRAQTDLHIMQGNAVQLTMAGNSKAKLSGEADSLSVAISDNATLDAKRLQAEEVELVNRDRSNAEIRATKMLYLDSDGNAETHFHGPGQVKLQQFEGSAVLRKKED